MEILQRFFILILNPIYNITKVIPERVRDIVISLCFGAFVFVVLYKDFWLKEITYTQQAMIGFGLLFMIVVMSINSVLNPIKWNKVLSCLWLVFSIVILIIGYCHSVFDGFRALPLTMLLGFSSLYFVWGNRGDYNKLYRLMSYGFILVLTIYYFYCFAALKFSDPANMPGGRYLGGAVNPNVFAILCLASVLVSVYAAMTKSKWGFFYLLVCGLSNFFIVMTVSRTAMIAVCLIVCLYMVFQIKVFLSQRDFSLKKTLMVILVVLTVSTSTIAGYTVQYYQGTFITSLGNELMRHENFVAQSEEVDAAAVNTDNVTKRFNIKGKDLDDILTGRLSIWQAHVDSITLTGHDSKEHLQIERFGTPMWAHNTVLEITYHTGAITGILFLLIQVLMAIGAMVYLFGKKYTEPFHFFSAASIAVAMIYFTVDVAIFPFSTPVMLLCFIGIAPLFIKSTGEKNTDE